jgi:hypothetical protein
MRMKGSEPQMPRGTEREKLEDHQMQRAAGRVPISPRTREAQAHGDQADQCIVRQ